MKMTKRIIAILMVLAMLIPAMAVITTANGSYRVAFNANTGVGGPGEVSTTGTLTIPSAVPTKDGMTFCGWATTAENAAKGIIAYSYGAKLGGAAKITVTSDTVLYAAWAYTVTLQRGAEGAGTATKVLYKFPGADLTLLTTESKIKSSYGMYSKNSDQRVFIEWNTKQDSTTSKGTGTTYREVYTKNESTTLYAIWGYRIQYNADGGTFPYTGNDIFLKYVANYDGSNYQNPKTLYGNFDLPEGDNTPVKEGCRLVTMSDGRVFYGLLRKDMSFFTTETAKQNLTIPPTGGKLPWSSFHTTKCEYGDTAVEFYAIWEPSVTYKANGGEGKDIVEYIEWDWDGLHEYLSYKVRSNSFTKDGAAFTGWNTEPDGSGTSYKAGKNIGGKRSDSDPVVLYAQWSDKSYVDVVDEYEVKYNANGGDNAPASQIKAENTDLTLTLDVPSRAGFIFKGWATDKKATEADYLPGDAYTKNADLTLYAVWSDDCVHTYDTVYAPAPTCTSEGVAYHTCTVCGYNYVEGLLFAPHNYGEWVDDGMGHSTRACVECGVTETKNNEYAITYMNMADGVLGTNTPIAHTFGTATKLVDPARTGYTFDGWYLEDGTKVSTLGAEEYLCDVILYAKWNANGYKITYKDYNNATFSGTLGEGTPTTHSYGSVTELVSAEKKGYTFLGWYTDKACTNPVGEIAADAYTAAFTLYAKWAVNSYDIEYYDMDGEEFSGVYGKNTPVSYTYTAKTTLVNPTKVGYTFGGWYTEAGTKVTALAAKGYTDTIRLYAKWTANTYAITYKDYNNAAFTGTHPEGYLKKHTYDTDTVLLEPARKGYTFLGWYSDKACTEAIEVIGGQDITKAVTVYAKWSVNSYAVSYYDINNATFSGKNPTGYATKHIYDTETILPVPTKTGYTFLGWYTDKACTAEAVEVIGAKDITAAITLYAKWEVNTYDIVYVSALSDDFTLPENAPTVYTYDKKTTLVNPTMEGYTFLGWYTEAGKKVTTLAAKSYTDDIVLTAKWKEN